MKLTATIVGVHEDGSADCLFDWDEEFEQYYCDTNGVATMEPEHFRRTMLKALEDFAQLESDQLDR